MFEGQVDVEAIEAVLEAHHGNMEHTVEALLEMTGGLDPSAAAAAGPRPTTAALGPGRGRGPPPAAGPSSSAAPAPRYVPDPDEERRAQEAADELLALQLQEEILQEERRAGPAYNQGLYSAGAGGGGGSAVGEAVGSALGTLWSTVGSVGQAVADNVAYYGSAAATAAGEYLADVLNEEPDSAVPGDPALGPRRRREGHRLRTDLGADEDGPPVATVHASGGDVHQGGLTQRRRPVSKKDD